MSEREHDLRLRELARRTVHGDDAARVLYPYGHSISCRDCTRVENALREAYALGLAAGSTA